MSSGGGLLRLRPQPATARQLHTSHVLLAGRRSPGEVRSPKRRMRPEVREKLREQELRSRPFTHPRGWQSRMVRESIPFAAAKDYEEAYVRLMGTGGGESQDVGTRQGNELPFQDNSGRPKRTIRPEDAFPDIKDVVAFSAWRKELFEASTGKLLKVFFQRRNRSSESYMELVMLMSSQGRGADISAVLKQMVRDRVPITEPIFMEAAAAAGRAGNLDALTEIHRISNLREYDRITEPRTGARLFVRDWLNACRAEALGENGDKDGIVGMMRDPECAFEISRRGYSTTPYADNEARDPDLQYTRNLLEDADNREHFKWSELGSNPYYWSSLLKAYLRSNDRVGGRVAYKWFQYNCHGRRQLVSAYHHILQLEAIGGEAMNPYIEEIFQDMRNAGVVPTSRLLTDFYSCSANLGSKIALDWVTSLASEHNIALGQEFDIARLKSLRFLPDLEPDEILVAAEDHLEDIVGTYGGVHFVDEAAFAEVMALYAHVARMRVLRQQEEDRLYGERVNPENTTEEMPLEPTELERARALKTRLEDGGIRRSGFLLASYVETLLWAGGVDEATEQHNVIFGNDGAVDVHGKLQAVWSQFIDVFPDKVPTALAASIYDGLVDSGIELNASTFFVFSRFFCLRGDIDKAVDVALQIRLGTFSKHRLQFSYLEYLQQLGRLAKNPEEFRRQMRSMGVSLRASLARPDTKPQQNYVTERWLAAKPNVGLGGVDWWAGLMQSGP